MRSLLTFLTFAVIAYVGVCAALFLFQRSLIYLPQPRALDAPASTMRLPVEGAELVVTVRPRSGARAILYFGGNAEDVSLNLAAFDQWFPGHALYLLHYRGYGRSTGRPAEPALHADAAALFAQVQAAHPDVTVIGRSLGSGVAVRLASEQAAARLVLVTPYDSLADIATAAYPFLPVEWLLRDRYDSGRHAPGIRIPTAIIAAEHDEVVPGASTQKLMARFGPGVASMVVIPGAGHNDLGGQNPYRAALQAAVLDR